MYVVSAHQNDIRPLLDIPVNQSLEQIVRRTDSVVRTLYLLYVPQSNVGAYMY